MPSGFSRRLSSPPPPHNPFWWGAVWADVLCSETIVLLVRWLPEHLIGFSVLSLNASHANWCAISRDFKLCLKSFILSKKSKWSRRTFSLAFFKDVWFKLIKLSQTLVNERRNGQCTFLPSEVGIVVFTPETADFIRCLSSSSSSSLGVFIRGEAAHVSTGALNLAEVFYVLP